MIMRNRKLPANSKVSRKRLTSSRREKSPELDAAMAALLGAINRVRREGGHVEFDGERVEVRGTSARPRKNQRATTALDAMRRVGLLGRLRRAPKDLSTNPEHMSGFGGV
jgi:hypothetical protein